MIVEWDEAKSVRCTRERGFSFADAARAFADPDGVVESDDRFDYGENRFRLLGRIESRLFVVVYTTRGETIRIISAQKANIREQQRHDPRSPRR